MVKMECMTPLFTLNIKYKNINMRDKNVERVAHKADVGSSNFSTPTFQKP